VDGVLEWLAARGWEDVEIVQPVEEHMQFSLPKELRRDLAGNRDERALGGRARTPSA
jgi:4-hydroxy-3-methylbut-2-en-1-yl diphosphate reductase